MATRQNIKNMPTFGTSQLKTLNGSQPNLLNDYAPSNMNCVDQSDSRIISSTGGASGNPNSKAVAKSFFHNNQNFNIGDLDESNASRLDIDMNVTALTIDQNHKQRETNLGSQMFSHRLTAFNFKKDLSDGTGGSGASISDHQVRPFQQIQRI